MAKFDVNKIIEESLCEINFGIIGDKVYDKLHPEDPNSPENIAFKHAQGFSKASSEGDVEKTRAHAAGLRRFFSKGDSKEADQLRQETIRDANANAKTSKALTYGSEEYNKLAKQYNEAGTPEAMKKAVESDNAKELSKVGRKALAKNAEETQGSVLSHLGRTARKVGDDIQSGVKNMGHKFADYMSNLDYGKTALATGGAIAAGLGALALRRRMKNAKRE